MNPTQLQFIFHPTPDQWGLRGDPALWQELEYVCATLQLPTSPAAIDQLLAFLYHNLVGEEPVAGHRPYVPRYQGGGMSGGHVSADFWLTQGFPTLKSRMLQLVVEDGKQGARR
ncbi:hypothetical protein SAMN02746009_01445 [Hymenobacter psychrotolerans DSM 18569]|uniref:Uncharacterized protein n=1 Tax=Hymenobacter psychrotolerans DSM 18569 TaxID=1121959 RepID=A0A1M6UQN2_9BACT|nr:hypothetical protein SAMN02746009_01445 [Hymenobacter psychrotolerans DSM 18569]